MKIGIVGIGIVGNACCAGFEKLGYTVKKFDIKLIDTKLSDLTDSEIIYIAVPTPSNAEGKCDTSIVESIIDELYQLTFNGIIAIKSTVSPGTTQQLINKYDDRILFVPEFLKERSAEYDFVFNQQLLLVGTNNINYYHLVVRSHGELPADIMRVSPTEAEMMKYYHNTFNATRIVFANVFYELCEKMGISYEKVKEAFLKNNDMPDEYLDVADNLRGYGGACLPKDVNAMHHLCKEFSIPSNFFKYINEENANFKTTVFDGMRK